MTHQYLPLFNSQISYYRFGSGSRLIIAFHGYSNDAQIFQLLESELKKNYTIIALDLPLHGNTRWNKILLTPKMLKKIIDAIIEKEQLPKEYWLMGFSLGGRIALSLFQYAPQQVKRLILLAPDGLYASWWHKFLVQTYLGNLITSFLLKHPKNAMNFLDKMKEKRFINQKVYDFAQGLLSSKRERTLLYARWFFMRKMRPNPDKICNAIIFYQTPVFLIFGKSDTITPAHNAQYLVDFATPYVHYYKWDAGHLLLREKYLSQLATLFK
ncbi:hypothetical protein A9P82_02615 [Arachidicoccus ginsenosidimutans]|uniref:alpha/beta fold hydrolase n=1 Tax=Arachidicoccus sp. BS20 TaxID=1850526 RepID=UPI0007F1125D|nr:alpha/beta hydrolase [Arachidicoccus sp. BS20]ANI88292.1 hypothetical protein A9P82_02615 [Arachidicoccus sp. BS20]